MLTIRQHIFIIFVGLLTILTISCDKKEQPPFSQDDFVKIYARLSVINSLRIEKEFYDRLIDELLTDYKTNMPAIQQAISYYNARPEQWVTILEQVREQITKMKNERLNKNATQPEPAKSKSKPFKHSRRKTPAEKNRE